MNTGTETNVVRSGAGNRYGIVLAGGSGTRLWPLSRHLFPKQLISLDGGKPLLRQAMERAVRLFDAQRLLVVTNEEHVFEVRRQVREVEPDVERNVLAEPLARNTLPAVLLALDRIVREDPEALVVVMPSDQIIRDEAGLSRSLERAFELAAQGNFVTFGVPPRKAETGYGYMERGRALGDRAYEVDGFVEKPGLELARELVESGRHFWNSGMFVFRAPVFLDAVATHAPDLDAWWRQRESGELASGYRDIRSVSVDYGLAEKLDNIVMVEASFDWEDQGSWEAMYRLGDKDARGNVVRGDVMVVDCDGCLLVSESGKLAAVGLRDMIMVQTRDATLACPLVDVQRVKDVVAALRSQGSSLAMSHPLVRRPWGSYLVLENGPLYKIKRIEVLPGARLSSQMHHHRSEHWVVVQGTAEVEINGREMILVENQSVDIPKTAVHRLTNPGRLSLELIEIQSGSYLEEDDIVRFDDIYGRAK
ncbi:MAG: mannose-1-phosphate guanylyltransferase/mannose-6-phosphate isomerase [Desulfovibrio sp.]